MLKCNKAFFIGLFASISTMLLWFLLAFYNPYTKQTIEPDALLMTMATIFLPSCLALYAAISTRPYLMLTAFLWSLPMSLYMLMTPSLFKWFGVASFLYFISSILMMRMKYNQQIKEL